MYQIYTADIAALCLSILIHYILHIVAVPRIPVCRYPPKQPEDQRQFPHRPNQSEWISAKDFFRLLYGCAAANQADPHPYRTATAAQAAQSRGLSGRLWYTLPLSDSRNDNQP